MDRLVEREKEKKDECVDLWDFNGQYIFSIHFKCLFTENY